ncbi:MAG: type II CAAX endopeptidase family protein [Eubacteriales bacterium]|nr:type II CAAX endopeptidase family protein [Eubacteriales bacterium]
MNKTEHKFSTSKTLVNILVYFLLFLAGELFSSIPFDLLFSFVELPSSALYVIFRMLGALFLTVFLFWLYTTKGLHMKMKDFGITLNITKWGVLISILLPVFVAAIFTVIGTVEVNSFSVGETVLIIIASMLIALKSGITEEMLFRGYIMKSLESRWNQCIAIFVPSFLFSLVHIPSMETFTVGGIALLMISGTLVGIMFSLVAYKGNSIGNSALLHTVWNFVMITDVLHITTAQGTYGTPIFSIMIPSDNALLTGAGFGMEASIIAIIGYILICGLVLNQNVSQYIEFEIKE